MKTAVIIPAGGSGKRMQGSLSKQYLLLKGIPVIVHTLKVFQISQLVHDVFLVVPPGDIEFVKQTIIQKYGISKVRQVLPGGNERQDSVKNGLDVVGDEYDIVVIHDGVRPFISADLVDLAILEASKEEAVTVGVPVKDTVKAVDQDGWIMETLSRDRLWLTQTPQVFKRDVIKKAYRLAYNDHYYGTDDAMLVERIGVHVKMLSGSYENIKITTKADLLLAEGFMKYLIMRDSAADE
jgi:2-C-methyl-D-erythritol 4-phosphate cytidylyltransferase